MVSYRENVILFPKWRSTLEKESLLALEEKKYKEALIKLDQLLGFGVQNHEIIIGKLMCLMELNRYKDAQDFCEGLLIYKDEYYYQYVHIYLTILFQTSQYQLLMNQVEQELEANTVPEDMKEQFRQLYNMSRKMRHQIRVEKSPEYINELLKAVEEENHANQHRLVEHIRKMDVTPTDQLKALLTDDRVHPVVKTAIFIWLQEKEVSDKVPIHKLGMKLITVPDTTPSLDAHPIIQRTLLAISDQEQENPTLFQLMEPLLNHYAYVRYPIMPAQEDAVLIAEALIKIGHDFLAIHKNNMGNEDENIIQYTEEI